MQAPLSPTASGEQFLSGLPSASAASAPPPGFVWISGQTSIGGPSFAEQALAPSNEAGVAEGIGLAHDAGNLLGAIRLYCDLLALPGVLRTEHRHYAEELRQLSARSGSLIDRLLTGHVLPPPMPRGRSVSELAPRGAEMVSPAEVVAACRGLLETIAGTGSLRIGVEAGGNTAVAVSREAMERILVNLTKNAVEASDGASDGPGAGAIALRVRPLNDRGAHGSVALSVEDRGRGMSESRVRSLLSGGPADGPGSIAARPGRGIGFKVVRELVAATGGELRIRSRVGRGTTVEIVWAGVPRDGAESG